jgi:hypothetical protein
LPDASPGFFGSKTQSIGRTKPAREFAPALKSKAQPKKTRGAVSMGQTPNAPLFLLTLYAKNEVQDVTAEQLESILREVNS